MHCLAAYQLRPEDRRHLIHLALGLRRLALQKLVLLGAVVLVMQGLVVTLVIMGLEVLGAEAALQLFCCGVVPPLDTI